jgi:Dockerin type I domain
MRFALAPLLLIATVSWADSPATHRLPYETYFRVIDHPPIEPGQSLEGWNSWRVPRGRAWLSPFAGPEGLPAIHLEPQTTVRRGIHAPGEREVWTAVFVRSAGGDGNVTFADLPTRPLSAVLVFDAANGIVALDGDGAGGGTPIALNVPLDGETLYDVAVRHDFVNQSYDVYVDTVPVAFRYGFRDPVPEFQGFIQCAEHAPGDMAGVWVSTKPPPNIHYLRGDVNTDGDVDAADLTHLLHFLRGLSGLSTQQMINADINESGNLDETDRALLLDILLGVDYWP